MSGYSDNAKELIELIGFQKALYLCNKNILKHNRETDQNNKWRRIRRYLYTHNTNTKPLNSK